MAVENPNSIPERKEESPVLSDMIGKTFSPDTCDGIFKSIDAMEDVPSSIKELNAGPALNDIVAQALSSEEREGVWRKIGASGAVVEREQMEEAVAAERIADFFKAYLPGRRKEDLVDWLLTSGSSADERRYTLNLFASYVVPDFPKLSDKGKSRLEELVAQKGLYVVMKEMFESLMRIDEVKAMAPPQGILQKFEGYAADMLVFAPLSTREISPTQGEVEYTLRYEDAIVSVKESWQWNDISKKPKSGE